jgi:hypothetical protein
MPARPHLSRDGSPEGQFAGSKGSLVDHPLICLSYLLPVICARRQRDAIHAPNEQNPAYHLCDIQGAGANDRFGSPSKARGEARLGTVITDRPSPRSVRAGFPHTAFQATVDFETFRPQLNSSRVCQADAFDKFRGP